MTATYSKPTAIPRWAETTGNKAQPPAGYFTDGWLLDSVAVSKYDNWQKNNYASWFQWLDERLDDGASADELIINSPSVGWRAMKVISGNVELDYRTTYVPATGAPIHAFRVYGREGNVDDGGDGIYGKGGEGPTTGGDGAQFDGGEPNGNGLRGTGNGTGKGIWATGGATSGAGVYGKGGAPNGRGGWFQGTGSSEGLYSKGGTIGSTSHGVEGAGGDAGGNGGHFSAKGGNSSGVRAIGFGGGAGLDADGGSSGGYGVLAQGGSTGSNAHAVRGIGGAAGGRGGWFTATAGNNIGVAGTGKGTGEGGDFKGGDGGGTGVYGEGGSGNAVGVRGTGSGTNEGVYGTGGSSGGSGVYGAGGGTNGSGVVGAGTGNAPGGNFFSAGTGVGVLAYGNSARGSINFVPQLAPSSPAKGDMYYNSVLNFMAYYDGTGWRNF